MATPIPFSVAPALRSGTFSTSAMSYPGGYGLIEWTLMGLGTGAGSDYENLANGFTATLFFSTDGGVTNIIYDQATWHGGHAVSHKGVVDPPILLSIGLANLPISTVFIQVDLTGTYTLGIGSGLIS